MDPTTAPVLSAVLRLWGGPSDHVPREAREDPVQRCSHREADATAAGEGMTDDLWFVVVAVIWTVSGVLTYGIVIATFVHSYPTIGVREHVWFALVMALLGPFGLFASLVGSGFAKHGLRYR
jgi:hypothetical protein